MVDRLDGSSIGSSMSIAPRMDVLFNRLMIVVTTGHGGKEVMNPLVVGRRFVADDVAVTYSWIGPFAGMFGQ